MPDELVTIEANLLYFNGYQLAIASSDVILTLHRNGKPFATLNCSYTIAKTLGQALTAGIADMESDTKQPILTVNDITMLRQNAKSNPE